MAAWERTQKWLNKKAKAGFRGYPVATVAFYGPEASQATKVAAAILLREGGDAEYLQRWFAESGDVRADPSIGAEVVAFIRSHGARSVAIVDNLLGCPHEEGVDYPDGESCPQCPYWAGRDRWANLRKR